MNHVMKNAEWYLIRGTGLTSLLLLTAVTVLGIATTSRMRLGGRPRFVTLAVHRSISLLSALFVALHILWSLTDRYARVHAVDAVIPFLGRHPVSLGLGTLSLDITAAVVVTSLLRQRVPAAAWRTIHWVSYLAYPAALLHSLLLGTDTSAAWFRGAAVLSVVAVTGAVAWRIRTRTGDAKTLAVPVPSAGVR